MRSKVFPKSSPIHLREKDKETYELSTIQLFKSSPIADSNAKLEVKYIAYISLQLAHIRTNYHFKPKTSNKCKKKEIKKNKEKRSSYNKKKEKTAIEIAFEQANKKL